MRTTGRNVAFTGTPADAGTGAIAVLVNPKAGNRPVDVSQLAATLAGRGFVREVHTPPELAEFAGAARAAGVEVVAVCGGDGTLGRVVTAICAEYGEAPLPAVAPLGGGTMNTIARSLGLGRARPELHLRSIASGGSVTRRRQSTMSLDGTRLGFMLGAGVPARFLELYERGRRLGALRALRVLAGLSASAVVRGPAASRLFEPVGASITIDDVLLECDRVSILYAAVIDDIGLGFRPTPRARDRLGYFQVLAAHAEAMDLVRVLPRIRMRGGVSGSPWLDVTGRHLRVVFAEPTVYMIDGDVEPDLQVLDVQAGPIVDMLIPSGG